MYEIRNLQALKILQKAREFSDNDLSNELLVTQILNQTVTPLSTQDTKEISNFITTLIDAKEKAKMSNK
ncbi:hypothetical protein CINS5915_06435 [Campylobacter insulaenigrae]|uniref:Uncharacterized protein n=2 Tax=Campylobacter insulaenigrae TaxID=260714 RepID=A0A0A8H1N1_9BACT|nr:hypothetical protein [Campylobacter insulaenigrae]AJC88028.1 hypothetical protein CINS_1066 [Campylobacter insulaenigrae NCTC 12927]MCR6571266.1 hypothetical protein [Campylobacter insulaenigrae]MCR6573048.1 hypothetical protein [Campylobacter insulaenigrae]MCR6574390.1 hypothetical protein [Campylobacter insulaenigrae]MCR6575997.1 hypothetical protein [Campylobacter insulaenigrae]